MAVGQFAVTALAAALFGVWKGANAAFSALIGGGIGIAAGLVMVAFMFRAPAQVLSAGDNAQRIMRNAYKGEAAKLGLTIVLFALALIFLELSALPLFVTYIAALLVHWVALVRI
jgi:ATP synthase protein I